MAIILRDGTNPSQLASINSSGELAITGSISATNPSVGATGAAIPADATMIGASDGTDLQALKVDGSGNLKVAVETGGGGGTQYTDETAETAGAFTGTVAFGYNGTDVVGLRLDSSNNLQVNLKTALPAGSALVGQVEVSDGTNVLFTSGHPGYVQGTVDIAASQTIAVTQATAADLNATVSIASGQTLATVTTVAAVTAITDALPAGSNTIGAVSQASGPWTTTQTPATSGGLASYYNAALKSTAAEVKGSAGQLFGYLIANPNASTVEYVMFFNSSSPTVGSDTPIAVIGIPGGGAANVEFANGIAFSSVIYVLASSSVSSATDPSTGLVVTGLYK